MGLPKLSGQRPPGSTSAARADRNDREAGNDDSDPTSSLLKLANLTL